MFTPVVSRVKRSTSSERVNFEIFSDLISLVNVWYFENILLEEFVIKVDAFLAGGSLAVRIRFHMIKNISEVEGVTRHGKEIGLNERKLMPSFTTASLELTLELSD